MRGSDPQLAGGHDLGRKRYEETTVHGNVEEAREAFNQERGELAEP